jgi:hypothetical protein
MQAPANRETGPQQTACSEFQDTFGQWRVRTALGGSACSESHWQSGCATKVLSGRRSCRPYPRGTLVPPEVSTASQVPPTHGAASEPGPVCAWLRLPPGRPLLRSATWSAVWAVRFPCHLRRLSSDIRRLSTRTRSRMSEGSEGQAVDTVEVWRFRRRSRRSLKVRPSRHNPRVTYDLT